MADIIDINGVTLTEEEKQTMTPVLMVKNKEGQWQEISYVLNENYLPSVKEINNKLPDNEGAITLALKDLEGYIDISPTLTEIETNIKSLQKSLEALQNKVPEVDLSEIEGEINKLSEDIKNLPTNSSMTDLHEALKKLSAQIDTINEEIYNKDTKSSKIKENKDEINVNTAAISQNEENIANLSVSVNESLEEIKKRFFVSLIDGKLAYDIDGALLGSKTKAATVLKESSTSSEKKKYIGINSVAIGKETIASGENSVAMGENAKASGFASVAEGGGKIEIKGETVSMTTTASGEYSHAEGVGTTVSGLGSHAEGGYCDVIEENGTIKRVYNQATGSFCHAEGTGTIASGEASHSEGYLTEAANRGSHAEGCSTEVSGVGGHAEGGYTQAINTYTHAEGAYTKAISPYSHAEGYHTATGTEGQNGITTASYSHAEGNGARALGVGSHAEGYYTVAKGNYSHAEGGAFAFLFSGGKGETKTQATENYAHAEGIGTLASHQGSHTEGIGTRSVGQYSHVIGRHNKVDIEDKYVYVVGNGKTTKSEDNNTEIPDTFEYSNAHTLDWEGNAWYAGSVEVVKGIILSSSNGKKFKIKVDDNGNLSTIQVNEGD